MCSAAQYEAPACHIVKLTFSNHWQKQGLQCSACATRNLLQPHVPAPHSAGKTSPAQRSTDVQRARPAQRNTDVQRARPAQRSTDVLGCHCLPARPQVGTRHAPARRRPSRCIQALPLQDGCLEELERWRALEAWVRRAIRERDAAFRRAITIGAPDAPHICSACVLGLVVLARRVGAVAALKDGGREAARVSCIVAARRDGRAFAPEARRIFQARDDRGVDAALVIRIGPRPGKCGCA